MSHSGSGELAPRYQIIYRAEDDIFHLRTVTVSLSIQLKISSLAELTDLKLHCVLF
uniref:Uncharacterized protein n=1 Tax=Leclercia adecarboxylata TaxID=83655 RepID=A0A482LYY7_9ENTR|nr:Hypothetical protein [Leclercia adecarboxylata]